MAGLEKLPQFTYFPDPIGNGCIVADPNVCACCMTEHSHRYVGPRYSVTDVEHICPWCIADGRAAQKWDMSFNDIHGLPATVPDEIRDVILHRTPGFQTWQSNKWLFSADDALVFVGEVTGTMIVRNGDPGQRDACFDAMAKWQIPRSIEMLEEVVPGGQPSIYLFRDRATGTFVAYADMT